MAELIALALALALIVLGFALAREHRLRRTLERLLQLILQPKRYREPKNKPTKNSTDYAD
ncbi:MAG: hypothetical protein RH917_03020 [Lacipirellulaceae bacterium]